MSAEVFLVWTSRFKEYCGNPERKKERKKEMDFSESDQESEIEKKLEYRGEFYGESPLFIGLWSSVESEEEELTEEPLNTLTAAVVSCVILDAIDELDILKYVIGVPEFPWDFKYKTLTERYTRRCTPVRIFPQEDNVPVLTSAVKLQRDRESIESLFRHLSQTLVEEKSYNPLVAALNSIKQEELDDVNLIRDLRNNLIYLKELRKRVEEKRKVDEQEEKERDELMYHLQDKLDDVILKCEVEEKFVDKWERVRNAQNHWRLNMAENYFKDNISKFNTKIKHEKRATNEMQLFLKLCQAELEEELEEWMARYDAEMEMRENKILHLKYDRDQAEEKKHSLHKLYEERTQAMHEWTEFRRIRRIRTGASLVIQSWWRGMMVRKGLGPYKMKKKKEKKKK